MSIRQTVFALALVGASIPAAFASSGATTLSTDRGFEFHTSQSTKTRADVMKELEVSKKAPVSGSSFSRTLSQGDQGYVMKQHSFGLQNGDLVHTDKIAHNTPKPSLVMTDPERRLFQQLNRN
jgi:hypothetical protein